MFNIIPPYSSNLHFNDQVHEILFTPRAIHTYIGGSLKALPKLIRFLLLPPITPPAHENKGQIEERAGNRQISFLLYSY